MLSEVRASAERISAGKYRMHVSFTHNGETVARTFEYNTPERPLLAANTLLAKAVDQQALAAFLNRLQYGHWRFGDSAPFQAFPEVADESDIVALHNALHALEMEAHRASAQAWANLGRNGRWEQNWVYDFSLMLTQRNALDDRSLQFYTYEPRYRFVMRLKFNNQGGVDGAVFKRAAALERGLGKTDGDRAMRTQHYAVALERFAADWRAHVTDLSGGDSRLLNGLAYWNAERAQLWGGILSELSSYFMADGGVFYLQLRDEPVYDSRRQVATRPAGVAVGWGLFGDDKRPLTTELWLRPRIVQSDYIEFENENEESRKGA